MAWLANRLITRRSLLKTAGAAGATAATVGMAGCAKKTAASSKLAIVHTNDTHGHDLLDEESLGLAAAVQLRSDYEDQGYEVLLLDAGDAVQGTNMVNRSFGETATITKRRTRRWQMPKVLMCSSWKPVVTRTPSVWLRGRTAS